MSIALPRSGDPKLTWWKRGSCTACVRVASLSCLLHDVHLFVGCETMPHAVVTPEDTAGAVGGGEAAEE